MKLFFKVYLSQPEVCALLTTSTGARRVAQAVAHELQLPLEAPEVAFAMRAFSSFYAKFYNDCSSSEETFQKRDVLREVEVPEVAYLVLKALGFEEHQAPEGLCLRAPPPPSPA